MDERNRITGKESPKLEISNQADRPRKWLSHSGHSVEGRQEYRPHFRVPSGPSR
jgi:hypothetical protein